ncbi:hypothetical protein ACM75Y_23295 [Pseudomonas aeruginosa]|uniref:hypothetical protein n=1 Tax=Pseudomonas aeruginosa TaxID=287 RepID=UPI0028E009E2|nr:hypothetical protein [Pseudomonas aeruginosa]HBP1613647.1 hypothetical protein [Pseudomonas aeruginosa]
MYWIERCADGSYIHGGIEYPLPTDALEELEAYEIERSGDAWAKVIIPFSLETVHGWFRWDVQIIEYPKLGVTSLVGFEITDFPSDVILKDELILRLQDGWAFPNQSTPHST